MSILKCCISSALSLYAPITYIAFNKLNVLVRKFTTSKEPFGSNGSDNLDIIYDMNDRHIKKILFGDKTLIFYSPDTPDTPCDPAPDDSDMSNKDIDPKTWMDIPPYD